jgi:hypothetical protein
VVRRIFTPFVWPVYRASKLSGPRSF